MLILNCLPLSPIRIYIFCYFLLGSLKLDICVAGDSIKHCLTPELAKLKPYPGILVKYYFYYFFKNYYNYFQFDKYLSNVNQKI